MAPSHIIVVGAGVAGLTTALLLSRKKEYAVTVVAKHMPGDYDIEYASPWAGANYLPVSSEGTDAERWDRDTWPELEKLAKHHLDAGVHFQDTVRLVTSPETANSTDTRTIGKFKGESWYKHIMPNFRRLESDEVPAGFASGSRFTSVCINTALYLPWLVGQCLENGVVFQRAILNHICDAVNLNKKVGKADVIVNCTGMSAMKLGGVTDKHMVPVRGQTVLVRNEAANMVDVLGIELGSDEVTYVMQRAAGGGTLLGGSYQIGNWDSQVDPNLAIRIMERAIRVCPSLTNHQGIEHLSIIRHSVGLRPVRTAGTRIEKERIDGNWVIHNYGHGGYGYQSSYGCSKVAIKLVEEALSPRAQL